MKVSDLFVRSLENEGVEYVFGIPGEENEDLLFSLEDSPIQFVPTRHEQGAAFIANVWGRLTGRAGVCLSTLGPGATNLFTGIADANLDKAPVVAITAQGGTSRLHHESHQYLDIETMFKPITKWNTAVSSPASVTEVVRKAFKIAELEKPGATHIELSEDVAKLDATRKLTPIPPKRVRRPGPDYKAIRGTIELLQKAKRPLIIAGNGAIRKLASKHLTRLADRHKLPVVSTFMGKGAVSDGMPCSLLSIGLGFKDFVMEAVEKADLIITVGYDIAEYDPEKWNPKGDQKIIHIDFVPAEVYAHYNPEIEVVSDISAVLWELNQQLTDTKFSFDTRWYESIRKQILEDIRSYELKEGDSFTIPGVLNLIREILHDDGLLISDVGSHKMWIARNFPTYCPNGCIMSNGLASMGISLPGAIAASLVDPDRQIVAAMGDGGFLMNSQELETAKRLGTKFIIIVFNDNDYGLISWKQRMTRNRSVGTRIHNPDFKAYAESFGIRGYQPGSLAELQDQLKGAIKSRELAVVEIPVDTRVNDELVNKLKNHWGKHYAD
ncbi:MAG: acetolactate synthase large subunit [Candidatus Neomarinimicrobiota bacterium]